MAGFACPSNLSDGNGTSSSAGHNIILVVVVDYGDEDIPGHFSGMEVSVFLVVLIYVFVLLLLLICCAASLRE